MPWRPLSQFVDRHPPKLGNLRHAERAGLSVPETWWAWVPDARHAVAPPEALASAPLILRSASPHEDGTETSAAGRYVSVVLDDPTDAAAFRDALARVVAPLEDHPEAAVFVQPLVSGLRAGVAFFDGFHFERTTAAEGNQELTAGTARGEVSRGHLKRGDPWSTWLQRVHRRFATREHPVIDLEFVETEAGFMLLQVRPALFPVKRNPTISLANHREILGDLPSPWIVSAVDHAGRNALGFFAAVDPEVATWNERYAWVVGERAWLDFAAFFRLMDHWGLPRTFVTEGVGGSDAGPEDSRLRLGRMLRKSPLLVRLQLASWRATWRGVGEIRRLRYRLLDAHDLSALHRITRDAMELALRTNFGINGILSGIARVRRRLGLRGAAEVVTETMRREYEALRSLPPSSREPGLDAWLARWGHRGPFESDPQRPRFAELRPALLADLTGSAAAPSSSATPHRPRRPLFGTRWLYAIDRRRETFRDELMKLWQELRARMLQAGEELVKAGRLDASDDVFFLAAEDLGGDLRQAAASARARQAAVKNIKVPDTAPRDVVEEALLQTPEPFTSSTAPTALRGIALSRHEVSGRVVKADELLPLLERIEREALDTRDAILVAPSLEPSWGVVFGRFAGVVAEIGGELSHASILLREAGTPALVNCEGAWQALVDGERVRLDGRSGRLLRTEPSAAAAAPPVVS